MQQTVVTTSGDVEVEVTVIVRPRAPGPTVRKADPRPQEADSRGHLVLLPGGKAA